MLNGTLPVMNVNNSAADSDVPHPSYTETNRKSYASQDDVAEAWAAGKYPTHNVGSDGAVLYTGSPQETTWGRGPDADGPNTNFYGVQHRDGSGHLWHYSTRECIRLQDGTIINNQQCWSSGFAHCSVPDDYDYTVPLSAVEEHLDDGDTVFDIVDVWGQPQTETYQYSYMDEPKTRTSRSAPESIVVIDRGEKRYGVYLGRDSSIINGDSHFSFRLSHDELGLITEPTDALLVLKPHEVMDSELPVVDSDEFVETKLTEKELEAHREAEGKVSRVERGGRYSDDDGLASSFKQASWSQDYLANRQQFRADLRGNVIVRHGEWFFIPTEMTDEDDVREAGTGGAASKMGNHRAMRFHGARQPMQEECPHCGASSFDIDEDGNTSCQECERDIEWPIYVRGQIIHADNDHNAVNLGDRWHRAVSHDRDVLTYDDNPVPGRSGGGGWD